MAKLQKQDHFIRVNSDMDLPPFLFSSALVVNQKIYLIGDSQGNLPVGNVIRWESTDNGFVCHFVDPEKENLIEKDDGFYLEVE